MFKRALSINFDGKIVSVNGLEVKPVKGDKIDLAYNITGSVNGKEQYNLIFNIEISVTQISSERCQLLLFGNEDNWVSVGIYKGTTALVSLDIENKSISI